MFEVYFQVEMLFKISFHKINKIYENEVLTWYFNKCFFVFPIKMTLDPLKAHRT